MTKWTVTIEENPDNSDEFILPFPEDMLKEVGWVEGDVIEWINNQDGTYCLQKVKIE